MKKQIITALCFTTLFVVKSFAQTNSFPTSGSPAIVSIGLNGWGVALNVDGGYANFAKDVTFDNALWNGTWGCPMIRSSKITDLIQPGTATATNPRRISTAQYPDFTWSGGNDGFFHPAHGHVGISAGGTEALRVMAYDKIKSSYRMVINNVNTPQLNIAPIGTNADWSLAVNGKIVARSLIITMSTWADYVFAPNYKLPNLYDVEKYYLANKHLPEIPSEKEIIENGVDVAEMNKLLLKKIEELTILMVQQEKRINALETK